MSLIRQSSRSPLTRLVLAVALVCALLITQWRLNHHVVEHGSSNAGIAHLTMTMSSDELPKSHEGAGCLVCLEHQAHGAALTGTLALALVPTVSVLMARALPPNTPYLSPERARQRAPPVFS